MSVLSRQKDGVAAIVEKKENFLSEIAGNEARWQIAAPVFQDIPSRPPVRKDKVLAVRQQLAEGRYDLDERMNAVVESLLVVVTT